MLDTYRGRSRGRTKASSRRPKSDAAHAERSAGQLRMGRRGAIGIVSIVLAQMLLMGSLLAESSPSLAEAYVRCIVASDVDCAVALFHFPKAYSPEELRDDRYAVKEALGLFSREFGALRNVSPIQSPPTSVFASIGGASLPYWQQHPESRLFSLSVTFERDGPGLLEVETCRIAGREEIRSVRYGLPVSAPSSASRIRSIMEKLLKVIQPPKAEQSHARDAQKDARA